MAWVCACRCLCVCGCVGWCVWVCEMVCGCVLLYITFYMYYIHTAQTVLHYLPFIICCTKSMICIHHCTVLFPGYHPQLCEKVHTRRLQRFQSWYKSWTTVNVPEHNAQACDHWLQAITLHPGLASKKTSEEYLGRRRNRYVTTVSGSLAME